MSDRGSWTERHRAPADAAPPSPFIADALARLPRPARGARALDVACGRGRHALLLARAGFDVVAVDWALPALQTLATTARHEGLQIACLAVDVSAWRPAPRRYDIVLATNFLERPCLPRLRDAVRPGGVLMLETFLDGQQELGHPSNPDYLLRPGELHALCDGWTVLATHEGRTCRPTAGGLGDPAMMAGIVAQRDARTV